MPDGDPVSQKQFFETINAVSDKIIVNIDGVKSEISKMSRELGETNTAVKANADHIKTHCDQIDEIQKQQRGFTALASLIGGAIGSATAAMLKFFGGD